MIMRSSASGSAASSAIFCLARRLRLGAADRRADLVHSVLAVLSLVLGFLAFGYAVGFTGRDLAAATGAGVRAGWQGVRLLAPCGAQARRAWPGASICRCPRCSVGGRGRGRANQRFDGDDWERDFVPEPMLDHARRSSAPSASCSAASPRSSRASAKRPRRSPCSISATRSYPPAGAGPARQAQARRASAPTMTDEALEQNARLLEGVLQDFGVKGEIINVRPGPVVTLYELEPAPGIKSSRVIGLADDIARSMSAVSARVAVVPGRNAIGIELPNRKREMVDAARAAGARSLSSDRPTSCRSRSARPSAASRWWPILRACRIC